VITELLLDAAGRRRSPGTKRRFDVTRRRLFQVGLPEDRIARLVENAKRQVMPMDKVTQLTGRGMFGPSLAERMLGTGGWRTIVEADRFWKQFEDTFEKTRRVIEVWREEFRRTLPPNWQALDEAEIEVAGDIMERTGVRVEIVVGTSNGRVELEAHVPSKRRADVLDNKVEEGVRRSRDPMAADRSGHKSCGALGVTA
jgi:hypothetical protein